MRRRERLCEREKMAENFELLWQAMDDRRRDRGRLLHDWRWTVTKDLLSQYSRQSLPGPFPCVAVR
jgi:hypothetical protein